MNPSIFYAGLKRRFQISLMLTVLVIIGTVKSYADTHTWVGTTTTGAWTTATNWSPASIPSTGDDVIIGTTATNTWNNIPTISLSSLTIKNTASSITFSNATAVTITLTKTTGNALDVQQNTNTGTYVSIILSTSCAGSITSGKTLTIGGSSSTFTINGTLTANGSSSSPLANSGGTINVASTGLIIFAGSTVHGVTGSAGINVAASGELRWTGSGSSTNLGYVNSSGIITLGGTVGTGSTTFITYNSGSTLQYTGTSAQTAYSYEMHGQSSTYPTNITINNSSGVSFSGATAVPYPTIAGTLTLTAGVLNLGSNVSAKITFTGNTPIARTSGTINASGSYGTLIFNSTTGSATIPNGTFGNTTITRMTVNMTATGGTLTLNDQNITVTTLTMTKGFLQLGTGSLTVPTISGTGSSTNMIVFSATSGYLKHSFGTGYSTFTYPIGDNAGTAEYNGFTFTFNSNSTTRVVGFKVVDGVHPNNGSPTNYISRWYSSSLDITTGTYNYSMNLSYNGTSGDIVGSETKCGVLRYTGSAWVGTYATINSSSDYMYFSGLTETTAPLNYDIAARQLDTDEPCGAIALTPGSACSPVTGTILGATETFAYCGGYGSPACDVWYSFTATGTSHIISVTGNGTFAPVTQTFYNASGCASITSGNTVGSCTYSSTDGATITNVLTGLTAGRTYYVRVYYYDGGFPTNATFTICVVTPPANDECAGAVSLTPGTTCTNTTGDAAYATESRTYASCDNSNYTSPAKDLWYSFTATNTSHTVRVQGSSGYRALVQGYSGTCGSPTSIGCALASANGAIVNMQLSGLTVGTVYYVRVYPSFYSTPNTTSTFTICILKPPANDEPCGAVSLTPGLTCVTTAGDVNLASQTKPYTSGCDNNYTSPAADVWYSFVATNTAHTVNVQGSSGMQPVVQAYSGTSCSGTLTSIACDLASGNGGLASIQLSGLSIGTTYYVRVYASYYSTPNTTSTFTICVLKPPANDEPCGAVSLTPGSTCTGTAGDVNLASQTKPYTSACDGNYTSPAADVWYSFVATGTVHIVSVTGSSGMTPLVQVYSGTSCSGTLTSIDCDLASGNGGTATVQLTGLTISNTYYVRVYASYYSTPNTTSTFTICVINPPANDGPCGAITLTPQAQTCSNTSGDIAYGSLTYSPCSGSGVSDVWFKFNASAATNTVIVTGGGNSTTGFDPVVQAYRLTSGSCPSATFTEISGTCTDNTNRGAAESMTLTGLTVGSTYYVRVLHYYTPDPTPTTFTICVVGPPANDGPCGAIALTPGSSCVTTAGDVYAATETVNNYNCGSASTQRDVWYSFTAGATSQSITVTGSASFDAVAEAFTGSSCNSLTPISGGCVNNTSTGGTEVLALTGLTAGTIYYVRVYHNSSSVPSTTTFTICVVNPPANDECAAATTLTVGANCTTPVSGSTVGATPSGPTDCSGWTAPNDVWYSFVAPAGGSVHIEVTGTGGFNPSLNLRSAGACPSGPNLNCFEFAGSNSTEKMNIAGLTGGSTYKIRVYKGGTTEGTFNVCVSSAYTPAGNDNVANALTANVGTTSGNNNTNYGFEKGEPYGSDWLNSGGVDNPVNTQWFKYTPSASGCYKIGAPNWDSELAIYTASNVSNFGTFTEIASNEDRGGSPYDAEISNINLTAGTTYYIQLNGYPYSTYSSPTLVITSLIPAAPVATAATNISCTGFRANWNTTTNAGGYRLDVSDDNFATFLTGYNDLDVGNVLFYNVTGLNPGINYAYRVRAYGTCTGSPSTISSNVINTATSPAPGVPTFTAGATALCIGQGSTYTVTSANATSIIYSIIAGSETIDPVTGAVSGVTANFTVRAIVSNSCGADTADLSVTVNPVPTINIVSNPNPATICAGGSIQFIASGGASYTWSPVTNLDNPNIGNPTCTPSGTATYTVTGTSLGCSDTASITVTVNPTPTVTVSSNPSPADVCPLVPVTLTAGGATTYSWLPATGLNSTTGSPVTATLSNTTTYTVTGTSLGCTDTAVVTVTILNCGASWTGAVSSAWNNPGNWTGNSVPIAATDVTIPSGTPNQPVITTNASCNQLSIASGAVLTINPHYSLTAYGNTTLNGSQCLVLKSTVAGTASFIDNGTITGAGTARVERYITANYWHYISSPVQAATAATFNGQYLKKWLEPTYAWQNITSPSTAFAVMTGYALKSSLTKTYTYTGKLNTGTKTMPLTRNNSLVSSQRGWNLVGNPYPSAIDWDDPLGWTKTNVAGGIYIYNQTYGTYATYAGGFGTNGASNFIAEGQGFYVVCFPGAGSLSVNNHARVHKDTTFFKKTVQTDMIRLTLRDGLIEDEMIVRLEPQATSAFDSDFDAFKIIVPDASLLWSGGSDNEDYAINAISDLQNTTVIPVNFQPAHSGLYTITASEFENLNQRIPVWLEDLRTGTFTDLAENRSYEFYAAAGDGVDRFMLHFGKPATGITDKTTPEDLSIYPNPNNGTFVLLSGVPVTGNVVVYNVIGDKVYEQAATNFTSLELHLSKLSPGVYYLSVRSDNNVKTLRFVVN